MNGNTNQCTTKITTPPANYIWDNSRGLVLGLILLTALVIGVAGIIIVTRKKANR